MAAERNHSENIVGEPHSDFGVIQISSEPRPMGPAELRLVADNHLEANPQINESIDRRSKSIMAAVTNRGIVLFVDAVGLTAIAATLGGVMIHEHNRRKQ